MRIRDTSVRLGELEEAVRGLEARVCLLEKELGVRRENGIFGEIEASQQA